jgi:CRISPR-associated protein (TIGR03984 family)
MTDNYITHTKLTDFVGLTALIEKQGIIPGKTWAMAISPSRCLMLKVDDDGQLIGQDGNVVALDEFYEAVIFCRNWQITCARDGKGANLEILAFKEKNDTISQDYLVWGKVVEGESSGWCKIGSPRTGKFDFPAPADTKEGAQLKLTALELVEQLEHANQCITRQRLTGIGVYDLTGGES